MASQDLKNNIHVTKALNIAAISSSTTTAGVEIDTAGYESVTFVIESGAYTDGTFTPLVQESDTSGSYSGSVADADLIGTEADAALSAAHGRSLVGYNGKKRYVKLSIVSTSVSSGATVGATAILGHARHNPVS